MSGAHPGFKVVERHIEGEGYSKGAAGAILASASRKASPAAKKKNPNLKRVGGAVKTKTLGSNLMKAR